MGKENRVDRKKRRNQREAKESGAKETEREVDKWGRGKV